MRSRRVARSPEHRRRRRPEPAPHAPEALPSVRLSSADVRQVHAITEELLAPFAASSVGAWQRSVLRQCRELLGADMASFLLPHGEAPPVVSEDIPREHWQAFFLKSRPLDSEWQMWKRQVNLGVVDRRRLWGGHLKRYLQSPYYREFVAPNRYFDALILTVPLMDRETVGPDGAAGFWFHHQSERGRRFGRRGLGIMSLLLPSFRAAVNAVASMPCHHAAFAHMCDALRVPLGVHTFDGRRVHWTPALTALVDGDPEGGHLARAICAVPRQLNLLRCARLDPAPEMAFPERVVQTARGTYRISAALAPPSATSGGSDTILVMVRLMHHAAVADPRERHLRLCDAGLTIREAEVAVCIGDGKDTTGTANLLGISTHTVKRHLEKVYVKLGVSTRAEVGPAILRCFARQPHDGVF